MWKIVCLLFVAGALSANAHVPRSGNELVSMVVSNCVDMDCVKLNVLRYLDGVLQIEGDSARGLKVITNKFFIIKDSIRYESCIFVSIFYRILMPPFSKE